jgi:hypothetical protein
MKTALLLLLFVTAGNSASAQPHRPNRDSSQVASGESSGINCEAVRSYVSQVGLAQARALARASGMTVSQEWRAVPREGGLTFAYERFIKSPLRLPSR